MVNEKHIHDDLVAMSYVYDVEFRLLQDYANQKISQEDFLQYVRHKNSDEISQMLGELAILQQKIQQGISGEDPISAAQTLRKDGKQNEAYEKIVPYLEQHQHDQRAKQTFAWIMYDYLKQAEQNAETYAKILKKLNDTVQIDFEREDKYTATLLRQMLWSMRRVADQGELQANRIFEQFRRFVGQSGTFIKNEGALTDKDGPIASRSLIKTLRDKLSESNYFALMDMIGFDWFDDADHLPSHFTDKNGKTVEMQPLLESTLKLHAKKLLKSELREAARDKITAFLPILTSAIKSHPDNEWLPYYRLKLLIKLSDNEQALAEAIEFARHRSREYWVWDLISDLVDEEARFHCLCAGLLCKAKPEMIVKLQEKSVALLAGKGMAEEAKRILDQLLETRRRNNWTISPDLLNLKSSNWYTASQTALNLDRLRPYADQARKILSRTLPYTDAIITHINEAKGVISFAFMEDNLTKSGFLYKSDVDKAFIWAINKPIRLQMTADPQREGLYHAITVADGDAEALRSLIKKFTGTFESVKDFGFIKDSIAEIFVNPTQVREHNLTPFAKVSGTIIKIWDKKKECWGWQLLAIDTVEAANIQDYEQEFTGQITITAKGYGFVDECYVPEDLISSRGIRAHDHVTVKAQKSWNKSKGHWSWRATEIL